MSSKLVLSINTSENSGDITPLVPVAVGAPEMYIQAIRNLISKILTGAAWASIRVVQGAVSAVNAVTFSSIAEDDTVTVCGTVFTGKDAPAGAVQFETGVSDASSAASLASVINAHTTVGKLVTASAAAAVVTLTCNTPGLVGNFLTLAISAHGSVTGATFASGAEGNNGTLHKGI
jgi:phage tail sheath gpL-like